MHSKLPDSSDVLAVVRESALRRLGRPLLLVYAGLAVFGVTVVIASVVWMHAGPKADQAAPIRAQVMAAIAPFGEDARESDRPAMQQAASAAFREALVQAGGEPDRYKVVVHLDELVGPMVFVQRDDGRTWPIDGFRLDGE